MTNPPQETSELKPCPWCGIRATQHNWYPDECVCMSEACVMFARVMKHDQWNTRATPPAASADDERIVREALELIDDEHEWLPESSHIVKNILAAKEAFNRLMQRMK